MNKKVLALIEHYVYASAGTAVGIVVATLKTPGHHNYTSVLWALAAGLVGPLLARLNPASLANVISAKTGIPEAIVAGAVTTGVADAQKEIAANNK
jgi:hypothetical protein